MSNSGPLKTNSLHKLLITLFVVFGLASAGCFFIAQQYYSERYLSTAPSARPAGRPFDFITFTQDGSMIGASVKSGTMELERWAGDPDSMAVEKATIDLGGALPVQWTIAHDGKEVAWLSDSRIYVQKTPFSGQASWPEPHSIEAPAGLRSFGLMPGGTIGLALPKGELRQVDPMSGATVATQPVGAKIRWAQFRGEYAAVATSNLLFLYRFTDQNFKKIEERPPVEGTFELRLPADGQLLAITRAGVRTNDGTRNAPGRVADVQMTDQGFLVATGDFPGIVELSDKHPATHIADAPQGAQLAASRGALAYTSKEGTVLLAMIENTRLTDTGRLVAGLAAILAIIAILALIMYLFQDKGADEVRVKTRKGKDKDEHLPKPPPELIDAISNGDATLWAGAGLSAPSGLALRTTFISKVFEAASNEEWCKHSYIDQYWKLIASNKAEEALDMFVYSDPVMRVRVGDLAKATYNRFAASNETHRQLGKLPFTAAITTNYDTLLERVGAPWAINVTGIHSPVDVLELGSHLIVKLCGDFAQVPPAILCRKDFRQSISENPEFTASFGRLFESRPIFFIGASIDGLLIDLETLHAPKTDIKHYAICGIAASSNWRSGAKQLKSRYNIEVFAASVETLQDDLKVFLIDLVDAVEKERARVGPAEMYVAE